MYKTHGIACQQYAQRNAENLSDVILMVVLSIQQNWLSVGDQMADVRKFKNKSKFLWGADKIPLISKAKTYAYLKANKRRLYTEMMAIIGDDVSDDIKAKRLMDLFLDVDGLGLPKAGFVCQLVAGLVGCMDVHNIRRLGVDPKTLSLSKNPKTAKGIAANDRRIVDYVNLCHNYGTENLWNTWCDFLSTKSARWQDGNHVSEVHYRYLTGK
tara:strand:+ start:511 stop:1146 length:636 start_codon:yes stop_codon:yes gene_type:complete